MSSSQHRIPDEHIYDGMVLPGNIEDKNLELLKTTTFDDSDVIIATYPKAGDCCVP